MLAVVLGLGVVAMGLFGVAAPSDFLEFGRSILSTTILYCAGAVRVVFGAVLLWLVPVSRAPKALRVLGVVLVIAGVVTPFVGVERSRAVFDWLSAQGPLFTRAWAGGAVVLGLGIVYAITGPRKAAA